MTFCHYYCSTMQQICYFFVTISKNVIFGMNFDRLLMKLYRYGKQQKKT